MAPPLTRPLVLSKAKHCQAVLTQVQKLQHGQNVDASQSYSKFWGGHGPPGPPTNEATGTEQGQALPSSTKQGHALACSYV